MAKLESETVAKNVVKSEVMIITVKYDKTIEVAYKKNANPKKLPKIGEEHPEKPGTYIEAEDGTGGAAQFAAIKWHHHSDCITLEIGGAQYQICFP